MTSDDQPTGQNTKRTAILCNRIEYAPFDPYAVAGLGTFRHATLAELKEFERYFGTQITCFLKDRSGPINPDEWTDDNPISGVVVDFESEEVQWWFNLAGHLVRPRIAAGPVSFPNAWFRSINSGDQSILYIQKLRHLSLGIELDVRCMDQCGSILNSILSSTPAPRFNSFLRDYQRSVSTELFKEAHFLYQFTRLEGLLFPAEASEFTRAKPKERFRDRICDLFSSPPQETVGCVKAEHLGELAALIYDIRSGIAHGANFRDQQRKGVLGTQHYSETGLYEITQDFLDTVVLHMIRNPQLQPV